MQKRFGFVGGFGSFFGGYGMILMFIFCVYRVGAYSNWSFYEFKQKFFVSGFGSFGLKDLSNSKKAGSVLSRERFDYSFGVSGVGVLNKLENIVRKNTADFRQTAVNKIHQQLPSPHSELLLGMVLGVDNFKLLPTYNDILKQVGLVHVVVVSGYNINLVYGFFAKLFGGSFKKRGLFLGILATFIYAVIAGFEVPAARAWLMCSLVAIFKFYGRPVQALKALLFSALLILSIAPSQLFSLSFILSFLATFGVLILADFLTFFITKSFKVKNLPLIVQDFVNSLAVFVMIAPVLVLYFGKLNPVSLLANPIVLWVVPICTVVGAVLVFLSFINFYLAKFLSLIIFPFLDFFVEVSETFASLGDLSLNLRLNVYTTAFYYLSVFVVFRRLKVKFES